MPARRRIDPAAGAQAVRRWVAASETAGGRPAGGAAPDRRTLATAVRFTLEELAACAPGRAVEVRVPPYGVTQAVAGTIFLIRGGRAEEDLDETDDAADDAAEARTPDDPPASD